ncbi:MULTISPECIES: glycosyltransferase family 1 protein [Burkholderia]|uniref:glycosyltransferase family 4 protein n=1 Tax=Burkholderia TaxID=32008 RepID=UPI000E64F9D7|nr:MULTISPECIES: glycosyltransferase family 1 protein [Burkholderia]MCR5891533.1 glycosyltransferase family 1 protein [Burkholderia sp. HAN2018]
MSYPIPPDTPRRVLLEMRPALDGFAGIPQETRLLFRNLASSPSIEIAGLLQTSLRFLEPGTALLRDSADDRTRPISEQFNRYSRVIVSLDTKPSDKLLNEIELYLKRRRIAYGLMLSTVFHGRRSKIPLTRFESRHFEEYVWQALFSKTLPAEDFAHVTSRPFRVCTIPWNIMQSAGILSAKWRKRAVYPTIDTTGHDVFIAQTPYPGRVTSGTTLVIRYHDALPIFMPHAFANKMRHQTTHFRALADNVAQGAYFACVSESTRQDLLSVFPELDARAVTIPNMVSHHYYPENSPPNRVESIILTRRNANIKDVPSRPAPGTPFRYLLMVSTLEPRKNHSLLISAFAALRASSDPDLKLVIVGGIGWDADPIIRDMRPWIEQDALYALERVPADELRVLYRHAAATVCPSVAEGFDFSGVEAMRSGGVVAASDIAVHREIYADAAEYFNAHCVTSLTDCLERMLHSTDASSKRLHAVERGAVVSERYLPHNVLPQWEAFLARIASCA